MWVSLLVGLVPGLHSINAPLRRPLIKITVVGIRSPGPHSAASLRHHPALHVAECHVVATAPVQVCGAATDVFARRSDACIAWRFMHPLDLTAQHGSRVWCIDLPHLTRRVLVNKEKALLNGQWRPILFVTLDGA